ncbi:helicase-associated domain-containing protein [Antiquaquibacter soli]|uniref:Helicase-associated domain-containing protein n=1 Tax=Antiquaquibacter soli TaxID=3064523 RepID=A0ABT9BVK5_9MICO|nr:helicase-associated domain-containing protein [Protaetiibacter sp. WY-16]MDO7883420.1 helicase-associated domain-containing protein [Protaetiibacter sp. WY-16]
MPAASDSALLLAGQLRQRSDDDLAALLAAREVRATGIRDFFDLADALLEPSSVQAALSRLDRPTLTVLAVLAELGPTTPARLDDEVRQRSSATTITAPTTDEALSTGERLALVLREGDRVAPTSGLALALAEWPSRGLPDLAELLGDPAPSTLAPVASADPSTTDRLASERAFATTASVAELIAQLQHEPARELARGGIALPDTKRLAAAMGVELDRVVGLVEIAERAGLVVRDGARWSAAESSEHWLVGDSGHRWSRLAGAWLERLPADVRGVLAERAHSEWGERLDQFTSWLFPAGGDWMRERIAVYTRDAELLGVTAHHIPSTPGAALLATGAPAAATAMAGLFPPEVEQVYLQHDLSVVSPGPLAPRVDARLRQIADLENRGLASTYRISAESLTRALASGDTAEEIRSFLSQISLTGIPQPLEYLLRDAAVRFGLVRVRSTADGHSSIHSDDAALLRTLLVDQSLSSIGLRGERDHLVSRFDRDVVFWSLSEARYPVAAEDASGRVVVPERRRAPAARTEAAPDASAALIARLRLEPAEAADSEGAWIARQLEAAIRSKALVTVTVRMPDGGTADYQLEPASVAGGRLRARDRRADLERTLPLASIVAVGPA